MFLFGLFYNRVFDIRIIGIQRFILHTTLIWKSILENVTWMGNISVKQMGDYLSNGLTKTEADK